MKYSIGTLFKAGLIFLTFVFLADKSTAESKENKVSIETKNLRVVIADNQAYGIQHRAGYNGVSELYLTGTTNNLFVPTVAGLNFEHIFNGDVGSFGWDKFEPRRAPMQLIQSSSNRVELVQERTEHWPLRSRMVYEVHGDSIDFTFYGVPLADAWQKYGYIGVFFASYIQAPEDKSIQFIGRSRPERGNPQPRWIKHLSPKHGVSASHRPAGSNWDPQLDKDFPITLVSGISDLEYLYPFYFGRSGQNVFIMMFERPRNDGELRFAQSPSGGGANNPAWDYVYFQRSYAVGREFSFRARAVYKKFESVEEVVRIYEQWSGEKVVRPEEGFEKRGSSVASPSQK
ncbi:MAG: hypothetical protein PHR77_12960 [Kiritimatiellae bacterium]|nr:hypothetical protein [Kiritimatiellia bacterium]MDD5519423.1 hypothetical protein [Kiritimatiellia bacterium]